MMDAVFLCQNLPVFSQLFATANFAYLSLRKFGSTISLATRKRKRRSSSLSPHIRVIVTFGPKEQMIGIDA
jgi:hypothetical protein